MNNVLNLYDHNIISYNKIKRAYDNGEKVVGIVHATGTGKSFNAIQLAYDNKDKRTLYLVPSNAIIEHMYTIIKNNPNLNFNRDFPNLTLRTYQSLINLSRENLKELNIDLLILDEFHHIGAPVWGSRVNTIIDLHPNIQIFGMTAYTVRDRATPYERDMANPETDELFSNKIVSRYDLCDAMIDGVLPKPIYKSACTHLIGIEQKLEEKVLKMDASSKEYQEYIKILNDIKKRITNAYSISDVIKKYVKPNGKYIYFCPPHAEENTNDIETIKKEAYEWFKSYIPEENIIFYTTTSDMGKDGDINRVAFYNDKTVDGVDASNKLRVMFSINQYNEGIHAPNIDGVILGRDTSSDIVYFEQIGRALAVSEDRDKKYQEYSNLSLDVLKMIAESKKITFNANITKEELIEKLLSPIIIDLVDNFDYIKELENNLKDRFKNLEQTGQSSEIKKHMLSDASFDIEIFNQDIFNMLINLAERLSYTWEEKYNLAKKYYEHYGNLNVPYSFKTINGIDYDENGFLLGRWLVSIRASFHKNSLSYEKQILLKQIGFNFDNINFDSIWLKRYELLKIYYEHYGTIKMSKGFKTINGIDYDENGFFLQDWTAKQRMKYKNGSLVDYQRKLLEDLNIGKIIDSWQTHYELAKIYYEYYGNLNISQKFKTLNGIDYDENGTKLGIWLSIQRINLNKGKLSEERLENLKQIGFNESQLEQDWIEMYNLAKIYYEHYGTIKMPTDFKTLDGVNYNPNGKNLHLWLSRQRKYAKKTSDRNINKEKRIKLLEEIGFDFDTLDEKWQKSFDLLKKYYNQYGNINIPFNFKTVNGVDYDEIGFNLYTWLSGQKSKKTSGVLKPEREKLLNELGIVWREESFYSHIIK